MCFNCRCSVASQVFGDPACFGASGGGFFGEGGILPWQTERILALLGPAEVTAEAASDADGDAEGRQAE